MEVRDRLEISELRTVRFHSSHFPSRIPTLAALGIIRAPAHVPCPGFAVRLRSLGLQVEKKKKKSLEHSLGH